MFQSTRHISWLTEVAWAEAKGREVQAWSQEASASCLPQASSAARPWRHGHGGGRGEKWVSAELETTS